MFKRLFFSILFVISGFSHHMGSQEWSVISSTLSCPIRTPPHTSQNVLLQESFNLVCCLPIRIFPGAGALLFFLSRALFPFSWHICTTLTFLCDLVCVTGATLTDSLTCSFLILYFFLTTHIHLIILVSFTSSSLYWPLSCTPCFCLIQKCRPFNCSVCIHFSFTGILLSDCTSYTSPCRGYTY